MGPKNSGIPPTSTLLVFVKKTKMTTLQKTNNVKKVRFGDPNMSIKKNIPARQRSFLARMGGVLKQVKGQKTLSPAYWSIRAWKKNFPL